MNVLTLAGTTLFVDTILREAREICRREHPEGPSRIARWLYLRALLAATSQHQNAAIAYLTAAVDLDASKLSCLVTLAEWLGRSGWHRDALDVQLLALKLAPYDAERYSAVASTLSSQGQLAEAAALYGLALLLQPTLQSAHVGLAGVLWARGRSDAALRHAELAVQFAPDADNYGRLGKLHLRRHEWRAAEKAFNRGLQLDPQRVDLRVGFGYALLRLGSIAKALDSFRASLSIDPTHIDALRCLACGLELHGQHGEAYECWLACGAALSRHSSHEEALTAYRKALAGRPRSLQGLIGTGNALLAMRKPAAALVEFEAALAIRPRARSARVGRRNASDILCTVEDAVGLDVAWEEDEWFSPPHALRLRALEQPVWNGSSLKGRTILIWTFNSFGDTIQFLRYLPLLKQSGATVLVECPPRLLSLIEQLPSVDRVIAKDTPLPHFDVHELVTRLPLAFRTRRSAIPADVPYLFVDNASTARWRERLRPDGRFTIGLSWGGNIKSPSAPTRFAPLKAFTALAKTSEVRFVSLQVGVQSAELLAASSGLPIDSLLDESCSVLDTAAVVANVDLVITVDTMVAHLAGALAKPTWTLLSYVADWRWFMSTHSSPWYPTMRLFRQSHAGNWTDLIGRVRIDLEHVVGHARSMDVIYSRR